MFDIGAPEFLLLAVIAVILFGPEKLPEFARKAARVVRYVRTAAGSAQQQLSKELGPGFEDLDVRDLNPKTFIQKHLLDDVQPIVADVKSEFAEVTQPARPVRGEKKFAESKRDPKAVSAGGPADVMAGATPAGGVDTSDGSAEDPYLRPPAPFDSDAT